MQSRGFCLFLNQDNAPHIFHDTWLNLIYKSKHTTQMKIKLHETTLENIRFERVKIPLSFPRNQILFVVVQKLTNLSLDIIFPTFFVQASKQLSPCL